MTGLTDEPPALDQGHDPTQNVPLGELGLSRRTYNALMRAGVRTVGQLMALPRERLAAVRNFGPVALEEIDARLVLYRVNGASPPHENLAAVTERVPSLKPYLAVLIRATPPPTYQTQDDPGLEWYAIFRPLIADQTPISALAIPESLLSRLAEAGFHTIADLARVSALELLDLPQMGSSSLSKLRTALIAYMLRDDTPFDDAPEDEAALPAEQIRRSQTPQTAPLDQVTRWLSSLEKRDRDTLGKRYGLDGRRLSLEEIGQQIGLTRERVRQIQVQSLRRLRTRHATSIQAVIEALAVHIRELGGVVTLAEAADWLQAQQPATSITNPAGAILLLMDLTEQIHYLRGPKCLLLKEIPAQLLKDVSYALANLLQAQMAPTAVAVLLDDFRTTPTYRSAESRWPDGSGVALDAFARACLRTDADLIEQEPGVYVRRQWDNHIIDNIVVALRQIGEPAHFTRIATEVNRQLPADGQATAHNVHATMMRYETVFTRVGHGTYALVEWGAKREDTIAETAAQILREAGHPLHIDTIADGALKTWQVNRSTVYVALHTDGYYKEDSGQGDLCMLLGEGVFSLGEWEAAYAASGEPVLPFCPPVLPDPPDFENALFESVIVANDYLAAAPSAGDFLAAMFAWAQARDEPKRWLQQGVLNSYYLLGLIPYTYVYEGANPRLRSTLATAPINELRQVCLANLTRRLAFMPAFWWLLRQRAPMRQKDLAAEFVAIRGDELDDTGPRLALLAGLGAVVRGADYQYRLTPLGEAMAEALGSQPFEVAAVPSVAEEMGLAGWDDLLNLGLLE